MDSFIFRAAWFQVVGRGGGGHGHRFSGREVCFAAPFCDSRARTVWGGGRGLGVVVREQLHSCF